MRSQPRKCLRDVWRAASRWAAIWIPSVGGVYGGAELPGVSGWSELSGRHGDNHVVQRLWAGGGWPQLGGEGVGWDGGTCGDGVEQPDFLISAGIAIWQGNPRRLRRRPRQISALDR